MYNNLDELKAAYKSGRLKIKDDEYLFDNLPYCKKCDGARYEEFIYNGKSVVILSRCQCMQELINRRKELARLYDSQNKHFWLIKNSGLSKRFFDCSFSNSKILDFNKVVFERCETYVKNVKEILRNNIGLYIWGDSGSGKTHLMSCIANELMSKGYSCFFTTLYEYVNMSQKPLFKLDSVDFLFIDDLGKDFIGRECNQNLSKIYEQYLFRIVDNRYKVFKPLIVSSNYSLSDLYLKLKIDKAILDRLNEICTRIIKLDGYNFRKDIQNNTNHEIKKIGI